MSEVIEPTEIHLKIAKILEENDLEEKRSFKRLLRYNFLQNVANGDPHFWAQLQGACLSSLGAILARCYYCMTFVHKNSLSNCPDDQNCPLYPFMISHDPDVKD